MSGTEETMVGLLGVTGQTCYTGRQTVPQTEKVYSQATASVAKAENHAAKNEHKLQSTDDFRHGRKNQAG